MSTLARDLLSPWDVAPRRIRLVADRLATTWRVESEGGDVYALKAGRPDHESLASLRSEAEWVVHLRATGLPVPGAVRTRRGELAARSGTDRSRPSVLYEWIGGRRSLRSCSPAQARAVGELAAHMHAAARDFEPPPGFIRRDWDVRRAGGLFGTGPDPLEQIPEAAAAAGPWLAEYGRMHDGLSSDPAAWGLITADLAVQNILWRSGRPSLVDFNDTGFGLFAYDLAVTWRSVTDAAARGGQAPSAVRPAARGGQAASAVGATAAANATATTSAHTFSAVEDAFLAGYADVVSLPPGWGPAVKAVALIRLMRWRATRNPADVARLVRRLRSV